MDSTSKKQEQDDKEKAPELQVLTDKQIEAYNIPKELLWYISVKGEPVGPFHRDDLRAFLEEHPAFPRDSKVANLVEQKWLPLFKIPDFQRRRPQLVPRAELLENNDFIILKGGQKVGPFKLEFLSEKLERKEVLFNDLISIDQGESWIKVHEHPLFDRRNREKGFASLPLLPDENIFSTSQEEVLEGLKQKMEEKEEEEGLIGLAYFGKLKSRTLSLVGGGENAPLKSDEEFVRQGHAESPLSFSPLHGPSKGVRWKVVGPALFLMMLGGGAYLLKNWKQGERAPAAEGEEESQPGISSPLLNKDSPENSNPTELQRKPPESVPPNLRPRASIRNRTPSSSHGRRKKQASTSSTDDDPGGVKRRIAPDDDLIEDDSYADEDLLLR